MEITEDKTIQNLRKCPSFEKYNHNICPLDFDIEQGTGSKSEKCRWLQEESKGKIAGKEIIFGGKQMPDELLKFVPEKNIRFLNRVSRERWQKIGNSETGVNTP